VGTWFGAGAGAGVSAAAEDLVRRFGSAGSKAQT
jgi:hypothetical protein